MILWTDWSSLAVGELPNRSPFRWGALYERRHRLFLLEQEAYAAIGRMVVEGLMAPHEVYKDMFLVWDSKKHADIRWEWVEVES